MAWRNINNGIKYKCQPLTAIMSCQLCINIQLMSIGHVNVGFIRGYQRLADKAWPNGNKCSLYHLMQYQLMSQCQ